MHSSTAAEVPNEVSQVRGLAPSNTAPNRQRSSSIVRYCVNLARLLQACPPANPRDEDIMAKNRHADLLRAYLEHECQRPEGQRSTAFTQWLQYRGARLAHLMPRLWCMDRLRPARGSLAAPPDPRR